MEEGKNLKNIILGAGVTFALAFFGSWVQLNSRISTIEVRIDMLEENYKSLENLDNKIDVIIEQNKWIQSTIKKLENK